MLRPNPDTKDAHTHTHTHLYKVQSVVEWTSILHECLTWAQNALAEGKWMGPPRVITSSCSERTHEDNEANPAAPTLSSGSEGRGYEGLILCGRVLRGHRPVV